MEVMIPLGDFGLELRAYPPCCYTGDNPSLAEVGYAAYNYGGPIDRAGLNFQGQPCPVWGELPTTVVEKWESAAGAIQGAVTGDLLRIVASTLGVEEHTPAAVVERIGQLQTQIDRLTRDPIVTLRELYATATDPEIATALERAITAFLRPQDARPVLAAELATTNDASRRVQLQAALLVLQDPQPTPTAGDDDVLGDLIATEREAVLRGDGSEKLVAALTAARAWGLALYGTTLSYRGRDGRDRRRDTNEELIDTMGYAWSEGDVDTTRDARRSWIRRNP